MKSQSLNITLHRLSALIAMILLTYGLIRFIALPGLTLDFSVLGLLFRLQFDTRFFMLTLASLLAAAGAEWLIRSHPKPSSRSSVGHLVIPGLAALGTGAIITMLPLGWGLGLGFLLAGGFLFAVYSAEYITQDPADQRYSFAEISLRVLAFALYVSLIFVLEASGQRAAFSIPITMLASTLIAWRLIELSTRSPVVWSYPLAIGWIVAQISWGLHYWPLSPSLQAVVLTVLTYILTELVLAHMTAKLSRSRILELTVLSCLSLILFLALT
jgi:hypothetical protein